MRILVVDHNPERAAVVRQALVDIGGFLVEVAPRTGDLLLRIAQPETVTANAEVLDPTGRVVTWIMTVFPAGMIEQGP